MEGNQTLTLALVWQLMRAFTLSLLTGLPQLGAKGGGKQVEGEIIKWVNEKLGEAGKASTIKSFQDPTIGTGHPLIDLIDAIKERCINYDLVRGGKVVEIKLNGDIGSVGNGDECDGNSTVHN